MTKDISNKQQSHLRISEKDGYPLKGFKAGSETTKIRTPSRTLSHVCLWLVRAGKIQLTDGPRGHKIQIPMEDIEFIR